MTASHPARHLGDDTRFARAFEEAWSDPTPERLVALLHPDVVLYQPTVPPIRGREAALRDFSSLFRWLPGTHAVVDRSLGQGDTCYIELRLRFPIGAGVEVRVVDHFELEDGLGRVRHSYFDRGPIVGAVLARPWHLPGLLRYRLAR